MTTPAQQERDPLADARSGGSVPAKALGNGNTVRYDKKSNRYYVSNARTSGTSISTNLERDAAAGRISIISRSEALTLVRPPVTSTPPATSTKEERPTRSTGGGSSSAPVAPPAPTKFANTSTPTQELGPISNKAVTFADSPSNVNVSTPSRSFAISNFRAELDSGSVLPSHSYLVTFSPFRNSPDTLVLNQMMSAYRDPLTLRCENVVLPTLQLLEEENVRRYGYGPVEKIPYGVQFGDLTLTWIVDRYSEVPDFFHHWMNSIVTYEAKGALMREGVSTRQGLTSRGAYEVGFKDDYTCPVLTVNVYNQQLVAVADYVMYDVFPMNIQSANLSWAEENQYQKFTVTFAFTDMETRAPVKGYRELVNAFETGKINPNEEKKQSTNKGRDAARDGVQSESDPRLTALASSPFSGVTKAPPKTSPAKAAPPGPGAEKKNTLGQPTTP